MQTQKTSQQVHLVLARYAKEVALSPEKIPERYILRLPILILQINEIVIHELKKDASLTQEEIDTKIVEINQAEHDYDQATTPEQQKAADSRFSTCWDWFIENNIPFYWDMKEHVYRYGKKPA